MLVALYRTAKADRERGRRHRTPGQLMCQLLAALILGPPGRRFVFAGDGGYGTHEVARFCHRHRRH